MHNAILEYLTRYLRAVNNEGFVAVYPVTARCRVAGRVETKELTACRFGLAHLTQYQVVIGWRQRRVGICSTTIAEGPFEPKS